MFALSFFSQQAFTVPFPHSQPANKYEVRKDSANIDNHPFADGNGRMGRLWQTLILSEWRSELAWLPVETIIHYQQQAYYQVLRECDKTSDCTVFIDFILEKLAEALKESIDTEQQDTILESEEMSVQMSEENAQQLNATAKRSYLLLSITQP
nr:Fic family protein [Xenorhabdus sp. PB30.3]